MTFTYTFADAEGTSLKREDEQGNIAYVPTDPGNRDYAAFISSASTAVAYVEPPYVAPEPTPFDLLEARVAALEADHASIMNNNTGGY